jgi:hypothetical protein
MLEAFENRAGSGGIRAATLIKVIRWPENNASPKRTRTGRTLLPVVGVAFRTRFGGFETFNTRTVANHQRRKWAL